jgi:hypothetical protein
MAQLNNIPVVDDSQPGILDPSQRSRLLRCATNHLLFATFDENTAHAILPDTDTAGRDKRASNLPKRRIVVEFDAATCRYTWRFVPSARVDTELKGDEGTWPRLVDFCG